ncbi:3-hydroxybutyryl-CoA dehydrogenase [Brenneria roseae subsp. americana]|uniref:3-hydroxybutyryl-CoA dehydrogenase n=1 Tax=Brenneria roseae subsp. americana TaxID=1508507 RepID=A0A2U1TQN0_9GAMM|nr:3-hydroxyacyl-CoA dehydrogenase NAD-binding domain-containing protein [Brenneria roseae]PWC11711.1 3-hydroxybutyryl-CoA dehydrogenase [Brenneria roseae subsp. americana]
MTKKIAVIGAGLMGSGIAQTCAQAGFSVVNIDIYSGTLVKAKTSIEKVLDRKIAKGKITEKEKNDIFSRLIYSYDFNDVKGAEIIIEAVPEKIELKREIFSKIDKIADQDTIIVSNTSGLSISEIASTTQRPDKVMGIHFFYPAPVMALVELIRGIATSDDTYEKLKAFAVAIGKEYVDCPELPGFIVNRILVPLMNEAAFLIMEGCKPEDVDTAMKLGANHPMGPLELCDFVGIDVMLATMTGLYTGFKDSKYRPCPILENMVKAGHLGRKSGIGFYHYN